MRFRVPGTTVHARIAEPVVTTDDQYDVVDFGLEHEDGGIDSLAFGGSFYSLKRAVSNMNNNADAKSAEVTPTDKEEATPEVVADTVTA